MDIHGGFSLTKIFIMDFLINLQQGHIYSYIVYSINVHKNNMFTWLPKCCSQYDCMSINIFWYY